MYLEFYGLSEKPFSQTPDPRFLYWNDAYRETLASLSYGIRERKGFIAMLGEAGTGKTTLLRKLLDELGDDIVSVFLFNPNATFEEILEYTLSELGITAPSGRKLAMLQRLNEFLLAAYGEGRNTILLIDEAQDLDSEVMEQLRLLSNLETSHDKILQIVLSGQPELAEKLADPSLRQLKQRITVRCRIEPLRREELPSYLSARLAVAGGSPELFDPETLPAIWEFSTGIPRIINTVCDNALLLGYALGKRTIDSTVLQEVINDLRKIDVDTWLPTPTPRAPEEPAPQPPPMRAAAEEPAYEPPPRPEEPREDRTRSAARPKSGSRSLGWVVAAVLVGVVVLFAGGWLKGVAGFADTRPLQPAAAGPDSRAGAAGGSGAAKATAPTRQPAAPEPLARVAIEQPTSPAAPPGAPERIAPSPVEAPSAVAQDPRPVAPAPRPQPRQPLSPLDAVVAEAVEPTQRDLPPEPVVEPNEPPARDMATAPTDLPDPMRPGVEPEPAAATAPEPAPPATTEDDRLALARTSGPEAEAAPRPARAPLDRVAVEPGDTLLQMAGRRYGTTNLTILDMLRAVNPEIRDVDLIIAGSGLEFPDPGPASRIMPDGGGFSVLAMTTQTLSRALAVQSSLEDRLGRPVSLERVATRGGPSVFRVSVRGLSSRSDAAGIAEGLGSILQDPSP